jgi:aryl-alcohol dehydrogenase-like predicted oxidoreductase
MLQLAAANGIDTLDTAIAYGDSEACLGEVNTQGFKLVTKLPVVPDDCSDVSVWVQQQVSQSLARLGVTEVYGLLLHRSEQLLGPNGTVLHRTLQSLKDKGKIQKLGVSIYSPSELDALMRCYSIDLVQSPFNLIDRRLHCTGWLHRLKDSGVEVHTRSVFLQGLLLMTKADIPAKFAPWNEIWQQWTQWLTGPEVSAVQACLAFPLSFPEIDRVVVGVDSVNQLVQILSASSSTLISELPDLRCDDENLINPANWSTL